MTNEVSIRITASDATQAVRDKMKAELATSGFDAGKEYSSKFKESTEKQAPAKVPVEAKNPIDEAWRAQVQASIRSIAADAIKIPMSPDTAAYREELRVAVGELQSSLKQKIPVDIDQADKFKASVEELAKQVQDEVKAKIPVEADEPSAQDAGQKAGSSFASGLSGRQQLIGAAIAAGIVGGGPIIQAAGIGAGVLTLAGFAAGLQRGNPAVAAGWAKLKDDAVTAAQNASVGMVEPLTQAMGQIDSLIQRETPEFRKLFTDAAADVPILTQGVDAFVSNSLPGLEAGLANSQGVAKATSAVMGDLGGAVGQVGAQFGQNSAQVQTSLHALGSVVDQTGYSVSSLLDFSTKLASGALPTLASGFNSVLSAADGVLHVLGPIAPTLGQIAVYGAEAWGSFKLAGLASTGVTALSKGLDSLSIGLTSAGAKMLDTSAGSTKVGAAMAEAAGKGALFAGSAATMAETVAGPLGLALGIGAFALMLFGQNSDEAAQKAQQQATLTQTLAQALEQSGGAVDTNVRKTMASSLATDSNVQALQKYGVTVTDVMGKMLAGNGSIDDQVSRLQKQRDALGVTAAQVNAGNNGMSGSSSALSNQLQTQIDRTDEQITAWNNLKNTMPDAIKQQQAWVASVNANANAMGIQVDKLNQAQQATEAYDDALNNAVALYMQQTSAIKQYADATVAAAGANVTAESSFQQLDQAVTQAQQSVDAAANGIASAQHSLVDAGHAVDAARHSEQQAVQGVTDAQYSYQQALLNEKQAQQGLMAARQAAADQLAALRRQVIDQGDTEAEAKLRLVEAQEAVDKAGLTGKTLGSLGDPSVANQTQYDLLLKLQEAQHNLNDVQAQSADLNKQNAAAQAAGVDGAQGVIQAEQQLASAQHGVQQAARAVADAQYAERQASLAVEDAIWSQHSAQMALTQAQQAGLKAQQDLTAAKDADSRTLDIHTAAGQRNWQTVEDMFYKNLAVTGSVQDATKATENETAKLGFNQGAVQGVIDTLNGLSGKNFAFSVTGTPTLDMGPIKGILQDPTLGLFTNQRGDSGGLASAGRLATGGPISGPGGPTDDVIHAMLSAGEYVQPADVVDYYGVGFMEALRSKQLPKFASGGKVSPTDLGGIVGLNAGAAAAWGLYETAGLTANAMGAKPPLPTKMPAPGNFSPGAFAGLSALGAVSGTPASGGTPKAAQEYAAMRLAAYGWGADQMGPLIALWNQESGWNPWAVNPSSGAYGIPQSLGHGHPYDLGDYVAQINWGLSYIRDRYGSPAAAEGHEQAFNWYAAGGPMGSGFGGINDGFGPELVKLPNGSTVVPASGAGSELSKMGGQPQALAVEMRFTGNTEQALAVVIMNLFRGGQIQILPQYVHQ